MRNLKRALSLTLASVMLLGMMVVGAGAASFPDVDDDNNVEAIEVLNAVGVMIGDNGNFKPDTPVTRNEMAVIMAKLILGTYEADSYVGTHPFTDVPSWADRYVAACYASKIVAGRSATTYDGNSTVTAVEAAAMMLRALGYEDLSKNAARWDQPVAAKANEISLFKGMSGASNAPMNRDAVAKLALNSLESTMVKTVHESADIQIGDVTIPGIVRYDDRQDVNSRDYTIGGTAPDNSTLQLCEYLYDNDLKKNASDTDNMGRPATTWTYKGEDAVTAAAAPDYSGYITGSNNTQAKLVDSFSKKLKEAGATVYVNGDDTAPWTEAVGDYVEVYVDSDDNNQIDKIIVTQYSVNKLSGDAATRKDSNSDDIQVRVPGISGLNTYDADNTTETVHGYEGLVENDIVLWYQDGEGEWYLEKAASFDGILTATASGKLTISGTKYDKSGATGNFSGITINNFYKEDSTWYTDKNGNPVWVEGKESTELAYVVSAGNDAAAWDGSTTHRARLLRMDGTTEVVVTKDDYSASGTDLTGQFVKYTVKDDKYTLTAATAYAAGTTEGQVGNTANPDQIGIVKGNPTLTIATGTTVLSNAETVFLVRDRKSDNSGDKDSYTMYTGYANVPSMDTASGAGTADNLGASAKIAAYAGKNDYAKYVVVEADANVSGSTSAEDMFYVVDNTVTRHYDADGTTGYSVRAIKNGSDEIVDLMFSADPSDAANTSLNGGTAIAAGNGYVTSTYDSDGDITAYGAAITDGTPAEYVVGNGIGKANGTTFKLGGNAYGYNNDTVVYFIDKDNDLHMQTVADLEDSAINTFVAVRGADSSSKDGFYTIKSVFVKEKTAARAAVYTSGTITVDTTTAKTISLAGQTINVDTNNTVELVKNALNGITAISSDWTAAVDSTTNIKLTAKTAGAIGNDATHHGPAAAPAGFTETTPGAEATKATLTGAITIESTATTGTGDTNKDGKFKASFGGVDKWVTANNSYGEAFTAFSITATGYTATTTPTDGGANGNIVFTANDAGSKTDPSVMGLSFTDGSNAVAAVYTKTGVDTMISGATTTTTKSITIGDDTITVTGATLSAQLDEVVTYLNGTSALKTDWTASKSGSEIRLTAKSAGAIGGTGPASAPNGYTEVTAGVDAD